MGALASEIEGSWCCLRAGGQKSKEKRKQYFDENDILRELENLCLEAQGISVDRDASAVKPTENNEESASKQDKKEGTKRQKKVLMRMRMMN